MEGDARFAGSQHMPDFPYADDAKMLGLHGIRVESADEIGAAWDEALSSDRPVVIDALADPNVPTIPPAPTDEIKQKIAHALAGETNAEQVRELVERDGIELPKA